MKENVYEALVEHFTNERLDKIAFQDEEFRPIDSRLNQTMEQYGQLKLSTEEAGVANLVFDLYAAQGARYAFLAYRQGMEDAVYLLKRLGAI